MVSQSVGGIGCRLTVDTPQGKLIIDDGVNGPTARRYWADAPLEQLHVTRTERGYRCEGVEVDPAIPRRLQLPPGDGGRWRPSDSPLGPLSLCLKPTRHFF